MAVASILFVVIVGAVTLRLREQLREQVLRREAESLHAVALMQLSAPTIRLTDFGIADPTEDIFAALVMSSRLKGVLSIEVFDPSLERRAAMPETAAMAPVWWKSSLSEQNAAARFETLTITNAGAESPAPGAVEQVPVLEAIVSLRGTPFAGWTARYIVDGGALAGEFGRMDRALFAQASVAIGVGVLTLVGFLRWAFARLREANRRLSSRTAELAKANQELVFAAKTSAVGALSAHLLHGIRNPLAGLEWLALEQVEQPPSANTHDAWQEAIASTRRLRMMVNDVLGVFQNESQPQLAPCVSVNELFAKLKTRLNEQVVSRRILFSVDASQAGAAEIPARAASLASMVLFNLVENAIQACAADACVTLQVRPSGDRIDFIVTDAGPGLPETVRSHLFEPVPSLHGGSGLGLAISHRIAQHAGGELVLVKSDRAGTTFRLSVPRVTGVEHFEPTPAPSDAAPLSRTSAGSRVFNSQLPPNR